MIIIFSDNQDQHSQILYNLLIRYKVEVKLIFPYNIKNIYVISNKLKYLELEDGCKIGSNEHFFINRIPVLHYNHPLILFIYHIPYEKILIHPQIAAMVLSKIDQLKYFQHYPKTTIIKNNNYLSNKLTCVKSISQIRSTVTSSENDTFIINGLQHSPVQFQSIIIGEYIKTHIIGDDYFSYKVTANTLDPRISESKTEYINTPAKIINILDILKEKIGLNYFDCDLIFNDDNVYILEINSSPAPLMFAIDSESYSIFDRLAKFIINNEYKVAK